MINKENDANNIEFVEKQCNKSETTSTSDNNENIEYQRDFKSVNEWLDSTKQNSQWFKKTDIKQTEYI